MIEIPNRVELLAAALEARGRTAPYLRHTHLIRSADLCGLTGGEVFLKLENLQVTGAFKSRGPLNLLLQMSKAAPPGGVVAPTGGNHGLGLAWAAKQVGIAATIYLPRSADPDKVRRLRQLGAELIFCEDYEAAHHSAMSAAKTDELLYVSPYSNPAVIASDGVVGLEIPEDCPEPELVVVPVGGGGLISGIGGVLKALVPGVEVAGVEAAASPTFTRWLAAGEPGRVERVETIAEGLGGFVEPDTLTWPHLKRDVDRMEAVTDEEIVAAMRWMVEHHRLIVEPSGAAAVALLLRDPGMARKRRTVAIISGGNIAWKRFLLYLSAPI